MSSLRKMKRQMFKNLAKEGQKSAEEMAKVAAVEMREMQTKAAEFGDALLGAVAIAVMNDYGKLKDRSTRLENLCKIVNNYYLDIRKGKLTEKEHKVNNDFSAIFIANWVNYKEDKLNGQRQKL